MRASEVLSAMADAGMVKSATLSVTFLRVPKLMMFSTVVGAANFLAHLRIASSTRR